MKNRITHVKPGDIITELVFNHCEESEKKREYATRLERWVVEKVYPNVVLTEYQGFHRCYDYGWLVCNGYEKQDRELEALKAQRSSSAYRETRA